MFSLNQDPFKVDPIPKFREFEINIVRPPQTSADSTYDFVSTLKAIRQVTPPKEVIVPPRASFFDFATISDYEKQYSFSENPQYMEIRNFMVAISRIFDNRYIPFSLYRRNIKAPINYTYQVWDFLTKHGLINYNADKNTRPTPIVPHATQWPEIVYTANEQVMSLEAYEKKLHPQTGKRSIPAPTFSLMTAPHFDTKRRSNATEVPGLMTLGDWTIEENLALVDFLRTNPGENWEHAAMAVRTKTPEECARQAATFPTTYQELEAAAVSSFNEMRSPRDYLIEEALRQQPEMRAVKDAVDAAGEVGLKALEEDHLDMVEDGLQAAGTLALAQMRQNAERVKQLHKRRILELLAAAVDVTRASIEEKRKMISDCSPEKRRSVSESELSDGGDM